MCLQKTIWILLLISINESASYPHDYNGWVTAGSSLPRPSYNLAVGFDDTTNTIWLLGGENATSTYGQLVKYQTDNDIFIDINPTAFMISSYWGNGQYYSQLNEYIFMISDPSIHRFNVINQVIDINYYTIPRPVGYGGCLCILDIDDGYLVITGGVAPNAMDTVQILNISSNQWLSNIASLNTPRFCHTCNTFNNTVFVIGGHNMSSTIDTVEIYNFYDAQWYYITDKLSTGMYRARSVVYQHEIVTFGGDSGSDGYLDSITVINGITHKIYPVSSCTDIALQQTAAINAAGTIYLFGGWSQLSSMRYVQPTVSSTNESINESIQCHYYGSTQGPSESTHDPSGSTQGTSGSTQGTSGSTQSHYESQAKNIEIAVVIDVEPKSAGCYTMIVIVVIIMVSYLAFIAIFIFLSTKPSKNENKSTDEEDKDIAKKQKIFGALQVVSAIIPPIFYSKFTNNVFLGILIILFAGTLIIFQFIRHYVSSKNGKKLKMKSSILFVIVGNSLFNISQGCAIIAGVNYDYSNTVILIISSWFAFLGEDLFSVILTVFLELYERLYGVGAKVMYFFGFIQIISNSYIYASYLQKTAANINMDLHLFCDLSIEFAMSALTIQLLYFIVGIIVFFRVKDPKQNTESTQTMEQTEIEIHTDREKIVYLKWTTENVLEWILNLEGDKFKNYEEILRQNLEIEKIDGHDIADLDKSDLHRLGIKEFKLKQSLLKHIELLTKKENQINT